MNPTRRNFLQAGAGAAAATTLAGCLDVFGLADDEIDADGYAAFFAIHDWAQQVGGDALSFENPVGTGRMGHGWSPDADLTPQVASTDAFIYLDTEEFSWAQNLATNLERDYDDIAVIDLLEGLEPYLIPFDYDGSDRMPEPDHDVEIQPEDIAFDEFDIWDLRSQNQLGYWHVEHWHGGLPDLLVGSSVPVGIVLRDTDDRIVPLGEDSAYQVDARVTGGDSDIIDIVSEGNVVEFQGKALGEAEIAFEFYRGDELLYETEGELTSIEVVDELTDDGEFYDPHTWVDPIIVQEMVDRLADEMAALDPENEATFRENAAELNERVQGVHEQLESVIESAELDIAILAAHDSFQYVERRYDFELQTPTGISPDAQASRGDILGLIETIDENGIDTILYDPFEASTGEYPQIVDNILEESSAEHAEPLTPTEGTTEAWAENDWGWVEQFEEINIPSLEQALNPGS